LCQRSPAITVWIHATPERRFPARPMGPAIMGEAAPAAFTALQPMVISAPSAGRSGAVATLSAPEADPERPSTRFTEKAGHDVDVITRTARAGALAIPRDDLRAAPCGAGRPARPYGGAAGSRRRG